MLKPSHVRICAIANGLLFQLLTSQVIYLNVIWLVAASSLSPPLSSSGALPAGAARRATFAVPTMHTTPEHKIYLRLLYRGRFGVDVIDPTLHKKTPAYIKKGKLFNKNGYLLRININGTVDGTSDTTSSYGEYSWNLVTAGLDWARLGSARLGSARLGSALLCSALLCSALLCSALLS